MASKTDASSPEYQIKALEEGIKRAEENIQIFTQEANKQRILKSQLESELATLKDKK